MARDFGVPYAERATPTRSPSMKFRIIIRSTQCKFCGGFCGNPDCCR